jgi:hypothetical protein
LSGKRKGKAKFRNADEARRARELDAEWEQKQKEWAKLSPLHNKKKIYKAAPSLSPQIPTGRDTTRHIPSRVTAGGSTAPVTKVYTGDKIIGIATMHKSNAVPVFSDEQAVDIARMRRG